MSSSDNKLPSGLAAAAGVGAFAMPLVAPWYLLIVMAAALATTLVSPCRRRVVVGTTAFLVVLLVLQGQLSAPLAAACLSAAALATTARVPLAIGILVLNLSTTASAQELLAGFLYRANIEAAAPAILAAFVLALTSTKAVRIITAIGGGLLSCAAAWAASRAVTVPEAALAISALPITLTAAIIGAAGPLEMRHALLVGVALVAALAPWAWMPPRSPGEIWLLLPKAQEAFEGKFFGNYVEALHFAGLDANLATSAEEIPAGATVLMPWVTAPFPDDQRVGALARERQWTVVIGGEHTNAGGVAARIAAMAGRTLLRRDLTVPRGNTDDSGPMRIAEVSAWPDESILNRGASVTVTSLADKVLLAGDGWWAEPDIGEWLWVGDYVWRLGDRAGRLAMAAAADIGGARWVVLGDNSPLLNRQLIADPRAAKRILGAASLWPTFLNDLLVTTVAIAITIGVMPVIAVLIPVIAAFGTVTFDRPSRAWKDFYVGESGFDERNFNTLLADYPDLLKGRRLIRLKAPVSGHIALPDPETTLFLLVEGEADLGGVRFNNCKRLGSLATAEGPHLMDAQACRVTGQARVLIGTEKAAAAIAIDETIIILDVAFLGQQAPLINATWLLQEIGR